MSSGTQYTGCIATLNAAKETLRGAQQTLGGLQSTYDKANSQLQSVMAAAQVGKWQSKVGDALDKIDVLQLVCMSFVVKHERFE